jgi:hypothetical protein
MFRLSRRSCARGGAQRRQEKKGRVRPRAEQLEARDLPSVYTPAQIRQAYGFNQVSFGSVAADGTGQTIAIVDAYSEPNIYSDLNTFDQQFGIAGGSSSSFLTVATPQGAPAADAGWAMEIALDVEWAHAIAPGAKILLVEAANNNFLNLMSAVQYAAAQPGVSVVSMSWGGGEFSSETAYDSYFTTPAGHQGVTFVASSGDYGAPPSYPAVSPNVLSVGGTTLTLSSSGGYGSETAWSGSGGGLSAYEGEPGYQQGAQSTGKRGNPDVAYNADPSTGYYIYDSVPYNGYAGWWAPGGTSAGAPQWAALVAIADQGRALAGKGSLDGPTQTLPAIYSLSSSAFHDVTSGSNGYAAGPGYDEATGRGSPVANLVISGLVAYGGGTTSTGGGSSSGSGSGSGSSSGSGSRGGRRHGHHADLVAGPVAPPASTLPGQVVASATSPAAPPMVGSLPPTVLDPPPPAPHPTSGPATAGGVAAGPVAVVAAAGPAPVVLVRPGDTGPSPGAAANVGPADVGPVETAVEVKVYPTLVHDANGQAVDPRDARAAGPAGLAKVFAKEGIIENTFDGGAVLLPVATGEQSDRANARPVLAAALAAALAGYWRLPAAEGKPRRREPSHASRP